MVMTVHYLYSSDFRDPILILPWYEGKGRSTRVRRERMGGFVYRCPVSNVTKAVCPVRTDWRTEDVR